MLMAGLESLAWSLRTQRCESKGHFVPIGSQGFYRKGGEKARFDQHPVEAGAAVSACLQAFHAAGDGRWMKEAWSAFNWFLGDNDLQIVLYDSSTGGCRDGLHPDRANENQGAEPLFHSSWHSCRCVSWKTRTYRESTAMSWPSRVTLIANSWILDEQRLAIRDQQRFQCRRNAPRGWIDPAALPCGRPAWPLASLRRSFCQRSGRMAN